LDRFLNEFTSPRNLDIWAPTLIGYEKSEWLMAGKEQQLHYEAETVAQDLPASLEHLKLVYASSL
jgi:hypothetical protein